MARPVRVEDHYVKIRGVKRSVVIAPVPDDDIGLGFGPLKDQAVVYSRIDHHPLLDQRFVFLALFYGAFVKLEILISRQALDHLSAKIAVGHGVTYNDNSFAELLFKYVG